MLVSKTNKGPIKWKRSNRSNDQVEVHTLKLVLWWNVLLRYEKNDENISTRKISLAMKSFAKDILQIILNRKENLWNQWNS